MAARSSTPRTRAYLAAVALSVVLLAVLWTPVLHGPIQDRDEGAYATVAWLWNEGRLPYRDVFDHKPPLIHAIYRVGLALSSESFAGVRTVHAVLILAAAVACGIVTRRATGGTAATALTTVTVSALLSASRLDALRAHPEIAAAAAYCWAVVLLLAKDAPGWKRLFSAGCLASCGLLAKPVIAGEVLLLALYVAFTAKRSRTKPIGAYIAGLLLPVAVVIVYFAAHGALGPMRECIWDYNRAYASAIPFSLLSRIERIWEFAAVQIVPLFLVYVIGLVWGTGFARPSQTRYLRAWLLIAFLAVILQGRIYRHHLLLLIPPLAILAGVSLDALLQRTADAKPTSRTRALMVAVFFAALLPAVILTAVDAHRLHGAEARSRDPWLGAARILRDTVPEEETVLVWGAEPQVYWYAKRKPATRFIYKYPLFIPGPLAEQYRREFFSSLEKKPPAAAVVVRFDRSLESPSTSEHEMDLLRESFHPILITLITVVRTPHYLILAQSDLIPRFHNTNPSAAEDPE